MATEAAVSLHQSLYGKSIELLDGKNNKLRQINEDIMRLNVEDNLSFDDIKRLLFEFTILVTALKAQVMNFVRIFKALVAVIEMLQPLLVEPYQELDDRAANFQRASIIKSITTIGAYIRLFGDIASTLTCTPSIGKGVQLLDELGVEENAKSGRISSPEHVEALAKWSLETTSSLLEVAEQVCKRIRNRDEF